MSSFICLNVAFSSCVLGVLGFMQADMLFGRAHVSCRKMSVMPENPRAMQLKPHGAWGYRSIQLSPDPQSDDFPFSGPDVLHRHGLT